MQCQKHLFSLDPDIHYLNCAYKAPLMKSAEDAALKAIQRERNPSKITIADFFGETKAVKTSYGKLIGSSADRIAIIPSVTYGFASVLNNVKGKTNGKGIIIQDAFPSGFYSLERWCEENQNSLQIITADPKTENLGKLWNAQILSAIDESTSVVVVPTVHWMSGLKFDLSEIGKKCKQVGAYLVVDGTQSVGALPLDVIASNINALICGGYKWLFGPYSLGLLYLDTHFDQGKPLEESWMNRTNAENFRSLTHYTAAYTPGAGRYNVGQTSNFILMPMLKESLKQLNNWTPEAIQNYCKTLNQPLKDYVSSIGIPLEEETYSGHHLFALPLTKDLDEHKLNLELEKRKIILSARGEHLRVSTNVFNDENDILELIEALSKSRK